MLRTNTCGELNEKKDKAEVTLCGWVNKFRTFGGITFVDIRDRFGVTQLVFDPKHKDIKESLKLGREDVILAKGRVRKRPSPNNNIPTGLIEVLVDELIVLNKSEPLPLDDNADEDTRLKYRYIDLRSKRMQRNIALRHQIVYAVRDYFHKNKFLEIETPVLAKSTPEGARDYLVPSRVNPKTFFALPQSPQLFKQLLMVSGMDRYFQIVKCFRDEDLRADRQPEFTQIDVEMSFVDEEDVFSVMEGLMKEVLKIVGVDVKSPFKRLTYEEAMEKYGSDKPDTRFGLELMDVTDTAQKADFNVFKEAGKVKCISVENGAEWSRKEIDKLAEVVKIYDAKGLAWMKVEDGKLDGPVAKFFSEDVQKELITATKSKKGDLLLFVADKKHHIVDVSLGQLRLYLAKKLELTKPNTWDLLWVTEFPMFEYDEEEKRHVAMHHPFTSPKEMTTEYLSQSPEKLKSKGYDLVLNGSEIAGGSIRIHKSDVQSKIFELLSISKDEAKQKFGFLLEAFKYGAPPHGGIAFGLDRLVAIMAGEDSIREVIAFPKTKKAESLLDGSPSEVDKKQLDELHISLK